MQIDAALFQENERTTPLSSERKYIEAGPLQCESGGELESVTVAYETWGALNREADNAVLVCHALTGDSHAVGWWDRLVGPGRAIDTNRYFVICANCLGGCQGSTGPASKAPDGKRYGSRFPIITMGDMVEVQARLISHLGIESLLAVAGGSMGGMQALEWTVRFPGRVRKAWITASSASHTAMQIGFNEAARQAVMRDERWNNGDYDPENPPTGGLAVARMIGHLSFLSDAAFTQKFGRKLQGKASPDYKLGIEYEVESYLSYQGDKFTRRFDANSLLYLTRAIDYFEVNSLQTARSEFLITSFSSDWLYPTHQSREIHELAQSAGLPSRHEEIDLHYGHDAFLLDGHFQGDLVREFLAS